MSLYLLLLALQADAPLDPPPLKIKPVVVTNPAPTTVVNPTITYTPAPKPAVNPTIIYTPAPKPAPAVPAAEPEAEATPATAGLSDAAVKRILAERKANVERQVTHRKELAAAQDAVSKALSAVPFDLDALKAALVNRDRVTTSYRERLTAAVLAMLDEVPAAERLAVAKAVIQGETPARTATPEPSKQKPSPVGR
ncbi:MAG TPA: hypothetical protein VFO42_05705 [Sphingomicrobium sp.]|nr:hypothetical protein [Sphingomicrobium sp.]